MADQPEALRLALMFDGHRADVLKQRIEKLETVNQELLEALRLTSIDCQYLHHAHKDRHLLFEECPVVARINAAIAKAEGEKP
jgi:hypothetical protein